MNTGVHDLVFHLTLVAVVWCSLRLRLGYDLKKKTSALLFFKLQLGMYK